MTSSPKDLSLIIVLCVSVICSVDPNIELLIPKIQVVIETGIYPGSKAIVLKIQEKISFLFCRMVSCQSTEI